MEQTAIREFAELTPEAVRSDILRALRDGVCVEAAEYSALLDPEVAKMVAKELMVGVRILLYSSNYSGTHYYVLRFHNANRRIAEYRTVPISGCSNDATLFDFSPEEFSTDPHYDRVGKTTLAYDRLMSDWEQNNDN